MAMSHHLGPADSPVFPFFVRVWDGRTKRLAIPSSFEPGRMVLPSSCFTGVGDPLGFRWMPPSWTSLRCRRILELPVGDVCTCCLVPSHERPSTCGSVRNVTVCQETERCVRYTFHPLTCSRHRIVASASDQTDKDRRHGLARSTTCTRAPGFI